MKLRSSRHLTRSSDLRAKRRASTDTLAGRESSRVPASASRPSVLHSVRKRRRELTHSNLNENKVYELRSGQFPVDLNSHSNTSRLGLSQFAHSKLGPASPRVPSGVRDNDSYRGRPENIAIPLSTLRECSICVERKGKYVLSLSSCLPPTDDRIKTSIPSFRMPPQMWSCRVSLQILHCSSLHECTRNTWAVASNTLPRVQGVPGRILC